MKTTLTFFFVFCVAIAAAISQEYTVDIVRLKDGKVYRGTIVSKTPTGTIELEVGPHNILVFERNEIRQITSEALGIPADSLNLYGGGVSLGFAVGGGGILGVPFRVSLGNRSAWEIGPYARPFILRYTNDYEVNMSVMVASAFHIGMKRRYHSNKQKIIAHGFFIRGGKSFGKYGQSLIGLGWTSERFKRPNKKVSFIHELGPGIAINDWYDEEDPFQNYKGVKKVEFAIAWKIHINGYLK